MIHSPGWAFTILSFLLVIGPLVFVHELGHYFVGRWCGVKIEAFSIGFGRELFGWTDRLGTRWKVAWLPLGGYVRFAGDMNAAGLPSTEWLTLPAEERARTFQAKTVWQRFLIVLAGPATNFLAAIVIFMGIFAWNGYVQAPAVVKNVAVGQAAQKAGVQPGDRVVRIGGEEVDDFGDLGGYVMLRPGESTTLTVLRAGREVDLPIVIGTAVRTDQFKHQMRIGFIGVEGVRPTVARLPLTQLPVEAVRQTRDTLGMILTALGQLVQGERSVKDLGGPLKMAQISGEQASLGWVYLFWLMAAVSINLGFINLLPIPMLDGGHLLFYLIEGVRRKPLEPEAQEWAFKAGLAALLTLMVFVTVNDLASFGLWNRVGGLIG